jgi:hypothetical protein
VSGDLMIAAQNAHVQAYDNLSAMPEWLSDSLCRLATGGGHATRALFTDADETIHAIRRPIILSSIIDFANAPRVP